MSLFYKESHISSWSMHEELEIWLNMILLIMCVLSEYPFGYKSSIYPALGEYSCYFIPMNESSQTYDVVRADI